MIAQWLLVWLLQLLADIGAVSEAVIGRLSRIVQIRVEVKELAPSQVDVIDMLMDLLAHINEVLSGHRIVDHSGTSRLLVALRSEER